jgi:hypothetical protein
VGVAVVAVVAYEVGATVLNEFLDADVVPSVMPRLHAITPRSVLKAFTPSWSRLAGWIAIGAVYTLVERAARSAMPARSRR